MADRMFFAETDSEDFIWLWSDGRIEIEEDGSSARGYPLKRKEAVNLASALLQWATQNRGA